MVFYSVLYIDVPVLANQQRLIQALYRHRLSLKDLPRVIDNRDGWWERIRELHDVSTSWWWWFTNDYHHHYVVPLAWISLTLSRHFSLSFIASGRSSGLHPVSSQSCCMYVWAVVLLLLGHMWGSIGVNHLWARPCFSSSVLHVWFVWLG